MFSSLFKPVITYFGSFDRSEGILAITALVGGVYTLVTLAIWLTSLRQTRQSLMPLPVLFFREKKDDKPKKILRVRNEGYGPALNITIDEWKMFVKDTGDMLTAKFKMTAPNILETKEERDLIFENYVNGKKSENWLGPHLDPEFARERILFAITYQDITGREYILTIALGTGNLKIVQPPRRYNIWRKMLRKIATSWHWVRLWWWKWKYKSQTAKNLN